MFTPHTRRQFCPLGWLLKCDPFFFGLKGSSFFIRPVWQKKSYKEMRNKKTKNKKINKSPAASSCGSLCGNYLRCPSKLMRINVPIICEGAGPVLELRRCWQLKQSALKRNVTLKNRFKFFIIRRRQLWPGWTFYCCYFSQSSRSQLWQPPTTGRLMAHPLGAIQRIWSLALAMAICVHWRCIRREGKGRRRREEVK